MLARVIDVDEHQIYLEIDQQLRFRANYVLSAKARDIKRKSRVDFEFLPARGHFCILIKSIKRQASALAEA